MNRGDTSDYSSEKIQSGVFRASLAILLLSIHLALYRYAVDDAYLQFRAAHDLMQLGSSSANTSQILTPSLSPIWCLWLYVLFSIFGNSLISIAVGNSVLTFLIGLLSHSLFRLITQRKEFSFELLTFFLSIAVVIPASIQLTEIPLALVLGLLGIYCYLTQRPSAFAYLGLASFCRLEMFAFVIICALDNWRLRRLSLKSLVYGLAVVAAPVFLLNLIAFGRLFPQSLHSRAIAYPITATEFLNFSASGVFGRYLILNHPIIVMALIATLTVLLIYFALKHLHAPDFVARDQRNSVLFACALSIYLGYAIGGIYIFPWYTPLYTIPLILSVYVAATVKSDHVLHAIFTILALPYIFNFSRDLSGAMLTPNFYSGYDNGARSLTFRAIGRELAEACPSCKVISSEVGALGYEFKGKLFDASGFATPQALQHQLGIKNRGSTLGGIIPPSLVREVKPHYIVAPEELLRHLRADRQLSREFQWSSRPLVEPGARGPNLWLLKRKDLSLAGDPRPLS